MIELLITLFVAAGAWRVFQKMGRKGWEAIIPFYNVYVLCDILYGQGWRMLLFLIPLYNIYFGFKINIDLSRRFHQGVGFGIGLTLLNVVFCPLLGFGNFVFDDGSRAAYADDAISRTLDQMAKGFCGEGGCAASGTQQEKCRESQAKQDQQTLEMLRQLDALHQAGVLSDEEYQQKKAELLKRF